MNRTPIEKRKTIHSHVGWMAVQSDVPEGEEVKQLWALGSWECSETHMEQRSIHRGTRHRNKLVGSVLSIVKRESLYVYINFELEMRV